MYKSIEKTKLKKTILPLIFSLILANTVFMQNAVSEAKIKISVNNNAITDTDIQQRVALLHLQHQTGDLENKAKQQLIEQELQASELRARDALPSNDEVDNSYKDFAQKNHMTVPQLSMMLLNANLSPEHFKNYIATQIGWQNLVIMRYRAENANNGMLSQTETIQRELAHGGTKPQVTEYNLQKVLFVLPDHPSQKALQQAKKNAAYFKKRFSSCDSSREIAANLQDVIIQNVGSVLAPQLPTEWKQIIETTKIGHLTNAIQSPEGLTALAICSARKVSDDRVAQIVYSMQETKKNTPQQLKTLNDKYLEELKAKARIVNF
ncbi:peptidylprolyl isomerase [Bartonella sp. TP]|uniref:peptidylprolyl isomerase n=1 Tax=Bartonella sp. TP TaxID=3057550 RepID=UPI0025AF940D|nr:peptidylprolyl isomerase [Bartonella sp. TP]MDN5249362.1 peptidylprolyl isomerase [Alphaproteobacteria bacterium]WJW80116.1 peptidylprolyl isomerase [Bartonella sp. TP]